MLRIMVCGILVPLDSCNSDDNHKVAMQTLPAEYHANLIEWDLQLPSIKRTVEETAHQISVRVHVTT